MAIERPDWGGTESEASEVSGDKPNSAVLTAEEGQQIVADIAARHETPDHRGHREPGDPATPADYSFLDADLRAEWEGAGGVEAHLAQAQKAAHTALDWVEDRAGFNSKFNQLPPSIANAAYRVLATTPRRKGDGAEVLSRLQQIEDSLSPADIETARQWIAGLSDDQRQGVIQALAS